MGTCTDIQENKEAREALEQAQRLQQVAGVAARVGGWTVDVATGRVHLSPLVYEILELAPGTDADLETSMDRYLPASRERLDAALHACVTDGTPFDLELQLRTYEDRPLWVRVIGEAARGRDLVVTQLYGALQDITKSKEVTLANDELARRLSTTLESVTDGFFTLDREWRFTFLNSNAAELLARRREDLLGVNMWDEFPEGLGTPAEDAYRRAMDGEDPVVLQDYHFAPLDRWFEVNISPSDEGLAVSFRDVTERRADRAALQERMKETEALASVSRDAAALTDPIEIATLAADRVRRAMRQPDDVGVTISLGEVTAHAGEATLRAPVFRAPIAGEGAARGEITVHDRSDAPLLDEEAALIQTVAETLSLWNERHLATRALEDANERLTDANQALEAASQLKDDLLSMASHELRTPLTPIIGFLEILQTRGEELREEQKSQLVRSMRTHATRMLRLVDDLLIVSRATAQVLESRPEDVDARDVIAPVLEELDDGRPGPDVELALDGCRLHVDPQHLQQIVFNLVSNARKYGEPPVTITAVPVAPGRVAIEVADRGPGVPHDFRDRMWERFEQKDRGDTRTARGTGLGLAIVKLLTEANGGTVAYRDAAPHGAIFAVELAGERGGSAT